MQDSIIILILYHLRSFLFKGACLCFCLIQTITFEFPPQVSDVSLFNISCVGDARYIFCFERSDKKYYGELLSPATNFLLSFPDLFPILSQFSPNLFLFYFSYVLLSFVYSSVIVLFFSYDLPYHHGIVVCKGFFISL